MTREEILQKIRINGNLRAFFKGAEVTFESLEAIVKAFEEKEKVQSERISAIVSGTGIPNHQQVRDILIPNVSSPLYPYTFVLKALYYLAVEKPIDAIKATLHLDLFRENTPQPAEYIFRKAIEQCGYELSDEVMEQLFFYPKTYRDFIRYLPEEQRDRFLEHSKAFLLNRFVKSGVDARHPEAGRWGESSFMGTYPCSMEVTRALMTVASVLTPAQALSLYHDVKKRLPEDFGMEASILTPLNLSQSGHIHAGGTAILCEALTQQPDDNALDLEHKHIQDEGASLLLAQQQAHPTLEVLNLAYNSLGNAGATALAELLRDAEHCKLQRLILTGNRLGDEGAQALASALRINQSLQYLDLTHNDLGLEGFLAIADALKDNTTLVSLIVLSPLTYTSYSEDLTDKIKQLVDAVRDMRSLESLELKNIDYRLRSELQPAMELALEHQFSLVAMPGLFAGELPYAERNKLLKPHLPVLDGYLEEDSLNLETLTATLGTLNETNNEQVLASEPYRLFEALHHLATLNPKPAYDMLTQTTFQNQRMASIAEKAINQARNALVDSFTPDNIAEHIDGIQAFNALMEHLDEEKRDVLFNKAKDLLVGFLEDLPSNPPSYFGYFQLYCEFSPLVQGFIDTLEHLSSEQAKTLYDALNEKLQAKNINLKDRLQAQCPPAQYQTLVREKLINIKAFSGAADAPKRKDTKDDPFAVPRIGFGSKDDDEL